MPAPGVQLLEGDVSAHSSLLGEAGFWLDSLCLRAQLLLLLDRESLGCLFRDPKSKDEDKRCPKSGLLQNLIDDQPPCLLRSFALLGPDSCCCIAEFFHVGLLTH